MLRYWRVQQLPLLREKSDKKVMSLIKSSEGQSSFLSHFCSSSRCFFQLFRYTRRITPLKQNEANVFFDSTHAQRVAYKRNRDKNYTYLPKVAILNLQDVF